MVGQFSPRNLKQKHQDDLEQQVFSASSYLETWQHRRTNDVLPDLGLERIYFRRCQQLLPSVAMVYQKPKQKTPHRMPSAA
jgi:hypothetical protein